MNSKLAERICRVIKWRMDIENGEFISAPRHKKDHMGFLHVSQKDLDTICFQANLFLTNLDSNLRVVNSMGEIRPAMGAMPVQSKLDYADAKMKSKIMRPAHRGSLGVVEWDEEVHETTTWRAETVDAIIKAAGLDKSAQPGDRIVITIDIKEKK